MGPPLFLYSAFASSAVGQKKESTYFANGVYMTLPIKIY